jgi:hypothetical protein
MHNAQRPQDEAIGPRDAVKPLGGDGTVVPPARFIGLANEGLAGRTLNARHFFETINTGLNC